MQGSYVIALDTHCSFTEVGVLTPGGRWMPRGRCPTTIPDLVAEVERVRNPREVVLEEGPLADWIARGLKVHAQGLTVCDPRRNHLIAKDSDKDDPIDAEKLARLYRGGYVKEVHHAESFDRVAFKRHVGLYHDAVKQRVRMVNRILGELRQYGLFVSERGFAESEGQAERAALLAKLPNHALVRGDVELLYEAYDAAREREDGMRRRLVRRARQEEVIVRFTALPGVKWVRASTFFVVVDTPWRFASKQALWKYLGVGLERRHSGGGMEQVRVCRQVNRSLKSSMLGAAQSAIRCGENPFAEQYERWIHAGLTPRIARRNVARSQAAVMWGMWKNGSVYRPEDVGRTATDRGVAPSAMSR